MNFKYSQAIATNKYHLIKFGLPEPEATKAAKWNYRTFGYGYVSLDAYLEYKERKRKNRLYDIDVKEWYRILNFIFKRDEYTCRYCGSIGGKLEGDHLIPLSKGGTNDLENLVTACRRCNRQKKDKSVEEFLAWRAVRNA